MDNHISSLKKRKRAQDEVDRQISVSTNVPLAADFDFSYWSSGDAKKLFVPLPGEPVSDCLARRIDLLRHCNSSEGAWVDGVETHDKDGLCKPAAVFKIRQQCMLLCQAYIFALAWMNQQYDYDVPNKTWHHCCNAACELLNQSGNEAATSGDTIMNWNRHFRKRDKFQHPNPVVRCGKIPEPSLFEHFPESKNAIKRFANGNLADLTTEFLRDFVITDLLVRLSLDTDAADERKELLECHKEKPPSMTTGWRWMRRLGHEHCARKKSFYVDGHERAEQRFHRKEFSEDYLLKLEPYCHRWLQVTEHEVNKWIEDPGVNFDKQYVRCGHSYEDDDGWAMLEFHVDTNEFIFEEASRRHEFGGTTSIRVKDEVFRTTMIFGQDESAFHQFLLKNKNWAGPNGERALLPKSDGIAVMISAFISRDTGLGLEIDAAMLRRINLQKYADEYAANDILKAVEKEDLIESPFVKYFELRANNEGYWGYHHMVLQLEDCTDCLKVAYPDFDFVFLFDHSSGHSKKRHGGLDAANMNSGFGGGQPFMRYSNIIQIDGYLGPFDPTLAVGDEQSMTFSPTDVGPFWMDAAEREERRFDRPKTNAAAPQPRNKSKKDLAVELSVPGNVLDPNKFKLEQLQEMASAQEIPLQKIVPSIDPGWVGKQKGLYQVLWERGWIDTSRLDEYAIIKKDDRGTVDEEFSLQCIMESCLDFANEATELQTMGEKMGVRVIATTKFHAEMAGEGIEYLWGVAKSWYRSKPLEAKRKKASFLQLVRDCLDPALLTKEKVRSFSKRARSYICAYYAFEHTRGNGRSNDIALISCAIEYEKIEQMVQLFRTHRCAFDFDRKFCDAHMRDIEIEAKKRGGSVPAVPPKEYE